MAKCLATRAPTDWENAQVARYKERLEEILSEEFRRVGFFQSGSFQHSTRQDGVAPMDVV